jgi:pyruvate/oxaloacetate carboxyltransferase
MALISLDSANLNIHVVCGIEESYKPTAAIKKINKQVEELKEKTYKYLEDKFKTRDTKVIAQMVAASDDFRSKWEQFLQNEYNPELEKIIEKIRKVNAKICPNYEETIGKKKEKID